MSNFISTEGPAIITLILKLLFFFKFVQVSRILGVKLWYNRTQEGLCEKKDADNGRRSETRKDKKLSGRRRTQQGLG